MSAEELRVTTTEFDEEFVADTFRAGPRQSVTVRLASRDVEKAKRLAAKMGFGRYQELLELIVVKQLLKAK